MKKITLITLIVFSLSLFQPLPFLEAGSRDMGIVSSESQGAADVAMQVPQTPDEQLAQETQRNQELLAIWKDHVRTLTKERDEAYKEIEALRSQASGSAPAEAADNSQQVEELRFAERELEETRRDKEVILAVKEEALRKNQDLEKQIQNLQSQVNTLASDNQKLRQAPPASPAPQQAVTQAPNTEETEKLRNANETLKRTVQVLEDNSRLQQAQIKDLSKKKDEAAKKIKELQSQTQAPAVSAPIAAVPAAEAEKAAKEIERMRSQIKTLESQAQALQSEKQQAGNAVSELKIRMAALQQEAQSGKSSAAELQTVKQANQNLIQQGNQAQKTISDLKSELEVLKTGTQVQEALQGELNKLRADKSALETSLAGARQEAQNQKNSAGTLQQANHALIEEGNQAQKTINDLRSQAEALQVNTQKQGALQSQMLSLQSELQLLRAENGGLRSQLTSLQQVKEKTSQEAAARTAELQASVASLEGSSKAQEEQANEEIQQLTTKLENLKTQNGQALSGLNTEIQTLRSESESLRTAHASELEALQAGRQEQRLEARAVRAENEKLKAENETLMSQLQESQVAVASLESSSKVQEEQANEEIQQLTAKLENLKAQNEQLASNLNLEIKGLQSQREKALQETSGLRSQVKALLAELEREKSEKAALEVSQNEMQKTFEALQEQISSMQSEAQSLRSEKEDADKTIEGLRAQQRQAIAEVQDLNARIDELKTENEGIERVKAERDESKRGFAETKNELETLRQSYDTLKANFKFQDEKLLDVSFRFKQTEQEHKSLLAERDSLNDSLIRTQTEAELAARKAAAETERLNLQMAALETEAKKTGELESALEGVRSEKQILQASYDELQRSFRTQKERLRATFIEKQDAESEMSSLKSEIQILKAENEKVRPLEEELSKMRTDRGALEKVHEDLENNLTLKEHELAGTASRIAQLEKENENIRLELKAGRAHQAKLIEDQRAALQANLSDIQNLKSNFESYLESLVQTFDERGKKG